MTKMRLAGFKDGAARQSRRAAQDAAPSQGYFMTLVAALTAPGSIVMAADKAHIVPYDQGGGHCRFEHTLKLVQLGNYGLGFSGADNVMDFVEALRKKHVGQADDGIDQARDRAMEVCRELQTTYRVAVEGPVARLMLCGFEGAEPRIYSMSSQDGFKFAHRAAGSFGAIGVTLHAVAIIKRVESHLARLDLERAKVLACYVVKESARVMIDVTGDVDLAVITPTGFTLVEEPERATTNARAAAIGDEVSRLLKERIVGP